MKFRSQLSCLFATLLVAACGGGSDSDSVASGPPPAPDVTVASTLSFPVDAAITAFQQSAQHFTLSAVDGASVPYTLDVTQTPGEIKPFNGGVESVFTTMITANIKKNGVDFKQSLSELYFKTGAYIQIGKLGIISGLLTKSNVSTPLYLPVSATVGQSGALNSAELFEEANASEPKPWGNEAVTWELQADTALTAWLCIKTATTPLLATGATAYSETDCYKINASGTVLTQSVTLTNGAVTLSFK